MAIAISDIKLYKTTNNLGGAVTATEVTTATLEDIFANITGDEAAAGEVKYACVYIKNTHGSQTLTSVSQWFQQNTPSANTAVKLGLGASAKNVTEQTITDENTAPATVSFITAVDSANALALPDLAPNDIQAIWFELTITAGAGALALDNFIVRIKGDTPA